MKIGPFKFLRGHGNGDDQALKEVSAELKEARSRLCRRIGYRFRNPQMLHEALRHPSAGRPNYDRLEFLGDSVLSLIVSEHFYNRLDVDEGTLTLARSRLVCGASLTEAAHEINLGDSLDTGPQMKGKRQSLIVAVAENALEALIGAVYLDGGFKAAREVVFRIFSDKIKAIGEEPGVRDPKSVLFEEMHRRKMQAPVYEIVERQGPTHNPMFRVRCHVPGSDLEAIGEGTRIRAAEQDASSKLCASLSLVSQ